MVGKQRERDPAPGWSPRVESSSVSIADSAEFRAWVVDVTGRPSEEADGCFTLDAEAGDGDCTCYVPFGKRTPSVLRDGRLDTRDCAVSFADATSRQLVCACLRRAYLSGTCRGARYTACANEASPSRRELDSGYRPAAGRGTSKYLNTTAAIVETLYAEVFPPSPGHEANAEGLSEDSRAVGLLVVAGSTNCGKSQVARGLIHKYLQDCVRRQGTEQTLRRPHLVTFEDPIEKVFHRTLDAPDRLVDYTPRQLGSDVLSLEAALEDALRQTPAVFYVGEVREQGWWAPLVGFAGSGHLVVTTTHASSLQEAIGRILLALGARTPSDRRTIANRLLTVIHMEAMRLVLGDRTCTALVPAMWRGNPAGVAGLMEYGLSSVVPASPSAHAPSHCLGRAWFAEKLLEQTHPVPSVQQVKQLVGEFAKWDLKA